MKTEKELSDKNDSLYSDREIRELAEWLEGLSLQQLFFFKKSYDGYLDKQAHEYGDGHVH